MASVQFENITLTYPILGGAKPKVENASEIGGAGSVIRDKANQSRSIIALEDISLRLKDGDRLGLIGRNGSGKSTLLRIVAGIYEPLEGFARIEGSVAGLFSAGLGVHAETTGYRNIILSGLMAGHTREEIKEIMPGIVEFCGLGDYLDMPVRTYSNGMAMRLTFACATAFNADIILMDEWLGAGDPTFQAAAEKRLRNMVDQAGILILASHNHQVIKRSCNKLAWLDRGRLRALGDVDDVLELHEQTMGLEREAVLSRNSAPTSKPVPAIEPIDLDREDRLLRIAQRREERRAKRRGTHAEPPNSTENRVKRSSTGR